ncbi:hypothetical protein ABK040_006140 [Willaertia magna]
MYANQQHVAAKSSGDEYSDESSSDSDSDDEEVEEREYTLEELKQYNGVDQKKIFVSVKGKVFDVTGSGFYGQGEAYSIFAGHDASKALALSELQAKHLDVMDISDLLPHQISNLDEMFSHLEMKYSTVGWLKEWDDAQKKDK